MAYCQEELKGGPDAPWPHSELEIYQILTCPDFTADFIQAHFN